MDKAASVSAVVADDRVSLHSVIANCSVADDDVSRRWKNRRVPVAPVRAIDSDDFFAANDSDDGYGGWLYRWIAR